MNRLFICLLFILINYEASPQLALWASTCDGTAASFTATDIVSIPLDISTDCSIDCFGTPTPTEGALQGDEQFEMNPDDQSFTFGIENTGSESVQMTELDFEIQRSNTGFNSYTIQLNIGGSFVANIFSEVYNQTAQVSRTATINQTLPAGQEAEFVVVVSGYQGDTDEPCNTPGNNGTFRFISPEIKGNVLPVELGSFSGKLLSEHVLLLWNTFSESNNSHFEVERKSGNSGFRLIGKVAGSGSTLYERNYEFSDNSPTSGINSYRLKQVDFDGQFTYSPVINVNYEGIDQIRLFPTIATDNIELSFPKMSEGTCHIQIFNINGYLLLEQTSIPVADRHTIQVDGFPAGQYYARTRHENRVQSFLFIKP
ncbi:MAG: hypothetical protein AAFZ15_23935 [Bacteroidota bacterium]